MMNVGAIIIVYIVIVVGAIFLTSNKLVCTAAVVTATVFLIVLSMKPYKTLTSKEYYLILFYRYACLLAILLFSFGDVMQDVQVGFLYDDFGQLLGVEVTPVYVTAIPIAVIAVGVFSLVFDLIIPLNMHGVGYSDFKPLGVFAIVVASLWGLKTAFLVVRRVFS